MAKAPDDKPARKSLNAAQKRALKAADVALFSQRYGRKAQKNTEPNDRRYDRDTVDRVRRMSPEELDRLMRDDEA